ncbi:MAG TPA: hypothetical protein PKH33_16870 [bacterium]|nr:hypothetical protein [bacterium]
MTNDERFERLEQEVARQGKELARQKRLVRWLPGATLLVCLLAFGLFEGAQRLTAVDEFHGEIKATAFTLVNEEGETRAQLAIDEYGPWLRMFDRDGEVRALFYVEDDGPALAMYDSNGEPRAVLWVDDDDEPKLGMYDSNGKSRTILSVNNNSGPYLSMSDSNDITRAAIVVNDDKPGLAIFDGNGKQRAGLVVKDDAPTLWMSDSNSEIRTSLSVFDSGPNLWMNDSNGIRRIELAASNEESIYDFKSGNISGKTDGVSGLQLNDSKGEPRFSLFMGFVPTLTMYDSFGERRVMLYADDEWQNFWMFDKNGNKRASIGAAESIISGYIKRYSPDSAIMLFDEDEKVTWQAP